MLGGNPYSHQAIMILSGANLGYCTASVAGCGLFGLKVGTVIGAILAGWSAYHDVQRFKKRKRTP